MKGRPQTTQHRPSRKRIFKFEGKPIDRTWQEKKAHRGELRLVCLRWAPGGGSWDRWPGSRPTPQNSAARRSRISASAYRIPFPGVRGAEVIGYHRNVFSHDRCWPRNENRRLIVRPIYLSGWPPGFDRKVRKTQGGGGSPDPAPRPSYRPQLASSIQLF